MADFGYVVLIIFIAIRVLIAIGLAYLIYAEVRKYRTEKRSVRKGRKADENADGKNAGNSRGSRE